MLKLLVDSTESQQPVMPVRWCIDRASLADLRDMMDMKIKPYVLFSVRQTKSTREDRHLFPLDQEVGYVPFHAPGEHLIFARIVRGESRSAVERRYLARSNGVFAAYTIWSSEGQIICEVDESLRVREPLAVVVADGHFAKEPPAWERKWVNDFFRGKAQDECEYRRRRMFAYTVRLFIYLLLAAVVGVALAALYTFASVCFLAGVKVDFRPIWPFGGDGSWEPQNAWQGRERYFGKPWQVLFRPIFPLMFFGIIWFINNIEGQVIPFFGIVCLALAIPLSLTGIVGVIHLLTKWSEGRERQKMQELRVVAKKEKRPSWFQRWLNARLAMKTKKASEKRQRLQEEREAAWRERYERLTPLLCEQAPQTNVAYVPRERRTIQLRFQELKARICKPYAAA